MIVMYEIETTETLNNKVNLYKLHLELNASDLPNYLSCAVIASQYIQIKFLSNLDDANQAKLSSIINNHDGEPAQVDSNNVDLREGKIRELTEMSLLHPSLNNNDVIDYLTSIDNYFNAWKRSGINTLLIQKIMSDAQDTNHPQQNFLNEVINPHGDLTYEYLISVVQ